MVKKSFSDMACSLAQAMDVIGEWWSMLIVRDFFVGGGRRRFEQLRDSLGISRNILTERLRTLTEAGVIEKVPLQEGGRRYAYQLTDKGRDLLPVMISIMQWWDRWDKEPGCGYMNVRERQTGEEIGPVSVQNSKGEPLNYGDLFITLRTPRGEMKIREWPLDFSSLSEDDLLELPALRSPARPPDHTVEFNSKEVTPAFPSATVVLVRRAEAPLEVLMVRRSTDVRHMGGMWVFPGGRVDPADGDFESDPEATAVTAAIRETREETGLEITADALHYISHWTTPKGAKKRFATWFYVGLLHEHQDVVVDGGEIAEHRWVRPADALAEQASGELKLMPSDLYHAVGNWNGWEALNAIEQEAPGMAPIMYAPRVTELDGALHFLYAGDAGFDAEDPAAPGDRHRCIMVGESLEYLRSF